MISKTLEDIEKDIKYLKEIANEEYFKKVEELCEKVNARSDKLQDKINKAIEIYKKRNTCEYKKKRFMEDKNTSDLMYEILKGE